MKSVQILVILLLISFILFVIFQLERVETKEGFIEEVPQCQGGENSVIEGIPPPCYASVQKDIYLGDSRRGNSIRSGAGQGQIGTGGEISYSSFFPDENYILKTKIVTPVCPNDPYDSILTKVEDAVPETDLSNNTTNRNNTNNSNNNSNNNNSNNNSNFNTDNAGNDIFDDNIFDDIITKVSEEYPFLQLNNPKAANDDVKDTDTNTESNTNNNLNNPFSGEDKVSDIQKPLTPTPSPQNPTSTPAQVSCSDDKWPVIKNKQDLKKYPMPIEDDFTKFTQI